MRILLLLILGFSCFAQSTVTLTGPTSARPGATVPIALTLTNSAVGQIVGLQWLISYPAGGYSATVVPGAASTSAGKGVQCISDNTLCLAVAQQITVIANGAVANYSLKIPTNAAPGNVTVNLSGLLAAAPDGGVTTINSAASYTFAVLPPVQDVNGDGVINSADYNAMILQVLGSRATPPVPCTADPNGDGRCDIFDVINIVIKIAAP